MKRVQMEHTCKLQLENNLAFAIIYNNTHARDLRCFY